MGKQKPGQEGYSLVEVVAALGILTAVLVPMLNFAAYGYNQRAYQKQMAATVAALKLEEWQNLYYREEPIPPVYWDPPSQTGPTIGTMSFRCDLIEDYVADLDSAEADYLRKATVTCWCRNCTNPDPQTVVGFLARVNTNAQTVKS